MESSPVIYFDGVCNLCTGTVQFILKRDPEGKFRFASLQGKAGQTLLAMHKLPKEQFKSFILKDAGRIYTQSTAALMVAKKLGRGWQLFYPLILFPRFIRDAVYNFISNNRYKWFGRKSECWIPRPEWQNRFLD